MAAAKESLRLIYIHKVGINFQEEHLYEFIFASRIGRVEGDDWDKRPADGKPSPPYLEHIDAVGSILHESLNLQLAQNSETFSMEDAADGVIALAWETDEVYDDPMVTDRLCFRFGETLDSVRDKLYNREFILQIKTIEEHGKTATAIRQKEA